MLEKHSKTVVHTAESEVFKCKSCGQVVKLSNFDSILSLCNICKNSKGNNDEKS